MNGLGFRLVNVEGENRVNTHSSECCRVFESKDPTRAELGAYYREMKEAYPGIVIEKLEPFLDDLEIEETKLSKAVGEIATRAAARDNSRNGGPC